MATANRRVIFIYVKDIVAANVFFATQSQATGVFNVAYGQKITIKELAQKIIALTGSKSEIKHTPERAGRRETFAGGH